jgi:hypothetical protein
MSIHVISMNAVDERDRKIALLISAFGVVLIAVVLLTFGCYNYPVPDGDAQYYWPPMLSMAKGEGLLNRYAPDVWDNDKQNLCRLVYHGYLYPMLVGSLVWKPDYAAIGQTISVILACAVVIYSMFFYRLLKDSKVNGIWKGIFVVGATLGCTTFLVGHVGRAETLGTPIVVLCVSLVLSSAESWHPFIFGVGIGLLAATHPMGCILSALLVGLVTFARYENADAFKRLCLAGLTAGVVWSVTFAFYPYSLSDWIHGLLKNGRNVAQFAEGVNRDLWYRWFTEPSNSLYGLIYIVGFILFVLALPRILKQGKNRAGMLTCTALICFAVWNYGIRYPGQNYNLLLFSPLVFGFVIWSACRSLTGRFNIILTLFCVLAGSLGFIQRVLVFPHFLKGGMSFELARKQFAHLTSDSGGTVSVSSGLFSLTQDYSRVKKYYVLADPELLILQQVNRGVKSPPHMPGYQLITSYFSSVEPMLFGVKCANTISGYNFAAYRKTPTNVTAKVPDGE